MTKRRKPESLAQRVERLYATRNEAHLAFWAASDALNAAQAALVSAIPAGKKIRMPSGVWIKTDGDRFWVATDEKSL